MGRAPQVNEVFNPLRVDPLAPRLGMVSEADSDELEVKTKFATGATAASHAVVPAVAGKKIVVLGYTLSSVGANTVKFRSAATDISGLKYLPANGTVSVQAAPGGKLFETAAGEALNMVLSAATAVDVDVVYVEV